MILDPEGHEVRALELFLPDAPRVIEIGCGDGRLTRRYAARVASVLAIDPDAGAIDEFRAAGVPANVDLRVSGVAAVDPPPQSVDVALFAWSL